MQATRYELKYCERCGSLRLRRTASAETYCPSCEQTLFRAPLPGAARQSKLLPQPSRLSRATPPLPASRPSLSCGGLQ